MNFIRESKFILWAAAFVAIVFGGMTIKSGNFALFGGAAGKEFAGNYVPFVLWFNFLSGFFYIIGGIGLVFKKSWSVDLAVVLASLILVIYLLFGLHILWGGQFQLQTVVAMAIRFVVWLAISFISAKQIGGMIFFKQTLTQPLGEE